MKAQKSLTIVEPLIAVHSPSTMLVMMSAGLLCTWFSLMLFSKMVVAPLVHLDDHDVDVELTIELSSPYLDVDLVVDNKNLLKAADGASDFLVEHEVDVVDHCCAVRGVDLQQNCCTHDGPHHPNGNGCYFNFSEIVSASASVM